MTDNNIIVKFKYLNFSSEIKEAPRIKLSSISKMVTWIFNTSKTEAERLYSDYMLSFIHMYPVRIIPEEQHENLEWIMDVDIVLRKIEQGEEITIKKHMFRIGMDKSSKDSELYREWSSILSIFPDSGSYIYNVDQK